MIKFDKVFDPSANKDGFTVGQSFAEYLAIQAVNASTLKQPTPLEMQHAMRREYDPLRHSLMLGSLVHKAILEPDEFDSDKRDSWLIVINGKSLKNKEAEAAHESNPLAIVACPEMVEKAARAKDAVWRHHQLRWALEQPGDSEVTALAWNEPTNCWRKARIDWRPRDMGAGWLLDFKTTSATLSPWALNGEIRKWGYDIQAKHYADVAGQLGQSISHFAFGWISGPWGEYADAKSEPVIARMTALDREPDATPSLLTVQPTYDDRLGKFCNAAATGTWEAWEHETIALGSPF